MPKEFSWEELWDYYKPEETHTKFKNYISEAKSHTNPEYYPQLLTQLARTQTLQQNWDKANEYLKKAKSIITEKTPVADIRYNLEIGRYHNSSGDKKNAESFFTKAWNKALELKEDDFAVDAAHMMAIVESDPDKQLSWNEEAIKIAEVSKDPKANGWLGSLYNNTGWSYFEKKDYTRALELAERALEFRLEQGEPNRTSSAKWLVGRFKRAAGEMEIALKIQLATIKYREEEGLEPDGFIHEELFEIYLSLGDQNNAKVHASKAVELLKNNNWFMSDQKDRFSKLKQYSEK